MRASKQVTLALLGAGLLMPGCQKKTSYAGSSAHGQTSGTATSRAGGYVGGYYGGARNSQAMNQPAQAITNSNSIHPNPTEVNRSGFGSTGRSRGGGWFG